MNARCQSSSSLRIQNLSAIRKNRIKELKSSLLCANPNVRYSAISTVVANKHYNTKKLLSLACKSLGELLLWDSVILSKDELKIILDFPQVYHRTLINSALLSPHDYTRAYTIKLVCENEHTHSPQNLKDAKKMVELGMMPNDNWVFPLENTLFFNGLSTYVVVVSSYLKYRERLFPDLDLYVCAKHILKLKLNKIYMNDGFTTEFWNLQNLISLFPNLKHQQELAAFCKSPIFPL